MLFYFSLSICFCKREILFPTALNTVDSWRTVLPLGTDSGGREGGVDSQMEGCAEGELDVFDSRGWLVGGREWKKERKRERAGVRGGY